jgi:hypothetical protein
MAVLRREHHCLMCCRYKGLSLKSLDFLNEMSSTRKPYSVETASFTKSDNLLQIINVSVSISELKCVITVFYKDMINSQISRFRHCAISHVICYERQQIFLGLVNNIFLASCTTSGMDCMQHDLSTNSLGYQFLQTAEINVKDYIFIGSLHEATSVQNFPHILIIEFSLL